MERIKLTKKGKPKDGYYYPIVCSRRGKVKGFQEETEIFITRLQAQIKNLKSQLSKLKIKYKQDCEAIEQTKKHPNADLERVPLIIIYRQGDQIYAEQPEEIINHFELYGFLELYTKLYSKELEKKFGGFEDD